MNARAVTRGGPDAGDAMRALLEPHRAAVVAKLVELARAGDPRSIEIVLRYLAPIPKPDAERLRLPALREAATLADKSTVIFAAVATGEISVDAGQKLFQALDAHARAVVVDDLQRQLADLQRGRTLPLVEREDLA